MQLFGHHISRRTLLLAALEIILILCCLQLALMVVTNEPGQQASRLVQNLLLTGLIVLIMETMGLYDREVHARLGIRGIDDMLRLGASLLLALLIVVLLSPWLTEHLPSTKAILIGSGLAFFVVAAERFAYRRVTDKEAFAHRILVLGAGSRAMALETSNAEAHRPYKVVSFVAIEDMEAIDVPESKVIQLEPNQSLLMLARSLHIEEIVVAIRNRRGVLPIRQLLECKLQGITVTDISTFFEREHQRLELGSMNTSWLVFGSGFRQSWFGNLVKRTFDLLLSLTLLLLTWPIMLITAIAIRLDSPGPIFYWQTRVGRGNKPFEICKFRSMTQDAERDGKPQWAASNDQRITRVGRIIRKLRIDELPQMINVFYGEMSFIGPRPERPLFVEQLSQQIPYFLARHSLRPGISGWAQVRYPYGASVEDARQKLQYDLYYVKNHTLFLDILILLETVKVVIFGRGAR
ncbi:MAG: TIGR03013 family XrtA/PEP-CTERM system glycosyltransferase [Lamprobacter sp.]|uniref:TIGR03013 family XrtA/PEP-CTERM system glycosyltransferase n=1 Tax=Lamprobacter sp. TaxID=3100796 RepID=UPI002B25DFFB|nr:TIGR03013 family XrtA/PEP-CTERM system glycosyltransferase [Lamprobacter sp.]MEA3639843.1 TIGR03013 family XrtA/PEP-CTERM system glycosyltransferase [Lamprobacter sp.]